MKLQQSAALCFAFILSCGALAQGKPAPAASPQFRGVYATIDVRKSAEMEAKLNASVDRRASVREVLKEPGSYAPPVLYALANAISGDRPEEAIFWYHIGRLRVVYDALRCRDQTVRNIIPQLGQKLSVELRRNQYYHRNTVLAIAKKAIEWDAKIPRDYDQRWIALHGVVAATSPGTDGGEIFKPEDTWPETLQHVHNAHLMSVEAFVSERPSTH